MTRKPSIRGRAAVAAIALAAPTLFFWFLRSSVPAAAGEPPRSPGAPASASAAPSASAPASSAAPSASASAAPSASASAAPSAGPDAPPGAAASPEERAKALFYDGVALLEAGEVERALSTFLQSRALLPSSKNTRNAALCLYRLGRFDEALGLYEEVLQKLGGELDPNTRAAVEAALADVRGRVGRLSIPFGTGGELSVDGRPRGKLPLGAPLALLPGSHALRVTLPGYLPFERSVDVPAGAIVVVDAILTPAAPSPPSTASIAPAPGPRDRGTARPPAWFVEAFGGAAIGPPLASEAGSGVTPACAASCPLAAGGLAGLRAGHLWESGFFVDLGGGYLRLHSSFERAVISPSGGDVPAATYHLREAVTLSGGFAAAGGGYALRLGDRFALLGRLSAGALLAGSTGSASATLSTAAESTAVDVLGRADAPLSAALLLGADLGLVASLGPLRAAVLVGFLGAPFPGPQIPVRFLQVSNPAACKLPGDAACAGVGQVPAGAAYGPFALWAPQVSIGYRF
jgi:hypothetical protein